MQDLFDVMDFLQCTCDPGRAFPSPPVAAADDPLLCRETLVFSSPPPHPPRRKGPRFCPACESELRALLDWRGKN